MSCAWMAIIETAFSLVSEPSTAITFAARQAVAAGRALLDLDEVAGLAPLRSPRSTISSGCRRSTGSIRSVPSWRDAQHAEHGLALRSRISS